MHLEKQVEERREGSDDDKEREGQGEPFDMDGGGHIAERGAGLRFGCTAGEVQCHVHQAADSHTQICRRQQCLYIQLTSALYRALHYLALQLLPVGHAES